MLCKRLDGGISMSWMPCIECNYPQVSHLKDEEQDYYWLGKTNLAGYCPKVATISNGS